MNLESSKSDKKSWNCEKKEKKKRWNKRKKHKIELKIL